MDNSCRNRNHPNHKYEQQIIKTDLCHKVISSMQELVCNYATEFGLKFLFLSTKQPRIPLLQAIKTLYKKTIKLFEGNNIPFDNHLHWIIPWRQAICFESLTELANDDVKTLITSFHPKSHNSLIAIFNHGLESYMRWYPWSWFSDLKFIGAGGFSAVYSANVVLPYDVPTESGELVKRPVALKVVDDKILNEITVQSKALVALLFHGMTVCESTGDLIMILTLAEDSNLNGQIMKASETSFETIADIVTRLSFNLSSLHDDIGMCHRNIHAENILCADDDYFLVDFRFSTSTNEASEVTRSNQVHYGRLPYIAPEVANGIYTEKSDVYSIGIIMWQLISGVLFPSPEIILDSPETYKIEHVPGISKYYQQVIIACLEPLPENRPTAEEIGLITRKIASTVQNVNNIEWKHYVENRREQCNNHSLKFNNNESASRLYTLNELSKLSNILLQDISFKNQLFDADSIAFHIIDK